MLTDKKIVYVVDDDVSVCRALSLLLSTHGFSVSTFNSADDFFGAVPNSVPGCLVLDIHMPAFDGWEVLLQLLISGSTRPVIVISADKREGLSDRASKIGAMGFLQKPFNDQELVDLINMAFLKKG